MPSGGSRRGGRRTIVLGAGGVVVAAAVAALWVGRSADDFDPRAGSVPVDEAPGLFEFDGPLDAYRIDYRVESHGGDAVVSTSDRLIVRRPFASRLESYDGPEPTGEPSSVQVADFAVLRAEGTDSSAVVVAAPPGPPTSDTRIAPALADALADGRFELGERRRVLGRTCQVIRSATLLASGDLAPPGEQDHADTCIDRQGLVLEELLVVDGDLLLRRVAIALDTDPSLDDDLFGTGAPTIPVDAGGGFVAETEPDSRQPGRFFESVAPPDFERRGRYVVIPPQQENFTDPTRRGNRLTYLSDVFVDGARVVVLDQGGTLGGVDPFPDRRGVEVEIDGLGSANLSFGITGPVVIVPREGGKFLRARGTVAVGVLVELLADLEEVEGGELRLLEDGELDQRGGG